MAKSKDLLGKLSADWWYLHIRSWGLVHLCKFVQRGDREDSFARLFSFSIDFRTVSIDLVVKSMVLDNDLL